MKKNIVNSLGLLFIFGCGPISPNVQNAVLMGTSYGLSQNDLKLNAANNTVSHAFVVTAFQSDKLHPELQKIDLDAILPWLDLNVSCDGHPARLVAVEVLENKATIKHKAIVYLYQNQNGHLQVHPGKYGYMTVTSDQAIKAFNQPDFWLDVCGGSVTKVTLPPIAADKKKPVPQQ